MSSSNIVENYGYSNQFNVIYVQDHNQMHHQQQQQLINIHPPPPPQQQLQIQLQHHHHHHIQQHQQLDLQFNQAHNQNSLVTQQLQHDDNSFKPINNPPVALNNSSSSSTKQEICQICSSNVSVGLHFGAVTCEACKKFFVRYINNQDTKPVCKRKSGDCVITLKTRADCFYCRLKKCLNCGMSVDNKAVKSQSYKEIQCQICTQPSSGTHFGVITCEACKTFFKRNITKLAELKCSSNGNCDVTKLGFSRSLCAYCRLNRCLTVGMDLTKSKVGRQSNLVKRNLSMSVSSYNNKSINEPPAKMFKPSNDFNDLFNETNSFSNSNDTNQVNTNAINSHTMDTIGVNNLSTKSINKTINNNLLNINQDLTFSYDLYKIIDDDNLLNDITIDINPTPFDTHESAIHASSSSANHHVLYPNSNCHNFNFKNAKFANELEHVINFLKKYAENYVSYCEAVESFSNLPLEDRKELTLNSVHAIRYLWLHKQNKNMNYFNLDDNDRTITTINDLFPIFKKADLYFKTIHESKIRNLCLDPKEFSLYSALIIFVVGYHGGKLKSNINKIKQQLSNLLAGYMHKRRNENESYQTLIALLPEYDKLQSMVQLGISERCKQLSQQYSINFPDFFKNFYIINTNDILTINYNLINETAQHHGNINYMMPII